MLSLLLDNKVVLEHSLPANKKRYYINLVHAQLYPDLGQDFLILFNNLTSAFNVQSLGIQVQTYILLSQEARLKRNSWRLSLNKELDFKIKILLLTTREILCSWSLIFFTPATSSLAVKQPGKVVATAQTKDEAAATVLSKDEAATVALTKDKAY
jgi:hypothetical protein